MRKLKQMHSIADKEQLKEKRFNRYNRSQIKNGIKIQISNYIIIQRDPKIKDFYNIIITILFFSIYQYFKLPKFVPGLSF